MMSAVKRERIWRREGKRCFWCGRRVKLVTRPRGLPWCMTFDHIVPRSAGGGNEDDNLVCSCRKCNERRGTKPAPVFLIEMMGLAEAHERTV